MATKDISDLQICLGIVARDFLRAQNLPWLGKAARLDWILETMTGQANKVVWSAMGRADGRGLINYGVNLRGAWLEPKGRELLANAPAARDGWGSDYRVGSLVTRSGDDVHLVTGLCDAGDLGDFLCLKAPAEGWAGEWCKQGESNSNITRRYSTWKPAGAAWPMHPVDMLAQLVPEADPGRLQELRNIADEQVAIKAFMATPRDPWGEAIDRMYQQWIKDFTLPNKPQT